MIFRRSTDEEKTIRYEKYHESEQETKEKTQINLIAVFTEKRAEAISIRAQSALKCITCPRLFTIEDQETFRLVFLTRARERVEEK